MKEHRFTAHDIMELPRDPMWAKFIMMQALRQAGFDLDGIVIIHEDFEKCEYVYQQF